MAEIQWLPGVPDEVQGAADPILRRWLAVVPTWCHYVRVAFEDSPEANEAAYIGVLWEYRTCTVTICPGWLTEPQEGRDEMLGHELLHAALAPMSNWVRDVFDSHIEDETLRDRLHREWRERFEGATSDLAFGIRPLLKRDRAPLKVA